MPDRELPEDLRGYSPGTVESATVDENETKTVWVTEPTPTVWCQSCGDAIDAANIDVVDDEERCPECGGNRGFYADDPEETDEPDVYTDGKVDAEAYWFELIPGDNVPLRKKNSVLAEHLTVNEDGFNIDADYYTDLLEWQIRDWFGSGGDMGLKMFLTSMTTVFEDLQDECPPPLPTVDEGESGK